MFFSESEHLRQQHPSLEPLIAQLDTLFSKFDAQAIARTSDYADILNADNNQVRSLFDLYEKSGILVSTEMIICDDCTTLSSAAEHRIYTASGEELLCAYCGSDLLRQSPRQVKVFRLSQHALHETTKNKMTPKTKIDHIVLLIHGIRTDATWQEKVASELNLLPGVEAQPIGYGILDAIRFWCPFITRSIALKKVLRKIRLAIAMYPGAEISVIAHSFGTYAIFRLLNETADLRFCRVLLCGSIVSDNYPWDFVQPRVKEPIVNDCGSKDSWPAAAKALTWGYGATGTFGFKSPGIRDRFHNIDHGGFFEDNFVSTYWVPFIEKGEIVASPWTAKRPSSPFWVKALASIPFQWIGFASIVFLFRNTLMQWVHSVAKLL